MPKAPKVGGHVASMPGAVFSPVQDRIADHPGPLFPLHVGDTWLEPPTPALPEGLALADAPELHRYSPTQGLPELIEALCEKIRGENGLACAPENLLVAAGATGSLSSAVSMLSEPGDEVLILAPFWPLIRGMVQAARAIPVEVPFYDRVRSTDDALEAVRERLSPRTVALYVSTPSNPTGVVLPEDWLRALAEFAREHDLWLLSDEVYEAYVYTGAHASIGRFAPERTLSVFSFSKTYGLAGYRVGYMTGPAEAIAEARKIGTHSFYHAPTHAQLSALRALREGDGWVAHARSAYQKAGAAAASVLGLPAPQGSTFLFVDVRERIAAGGLGLLLEKCFEDGVVVAPGGSSGRDYEGWIRLCYTCMPPDQVLEAVRRLAKHLNP